MKEYLGKDLLAKPGKPYLGKDSLEKSGKEGEVACVEWSRVGRKN